MLLHALAFGCFSSWRRRRQQSEKSVAKIKRWDELGEEQQHMRKNETEFLIIFRETEEEEAAEGRRKKVRGEEESKSRRIE